MASYLGPPLTNRDVLSVMVKKYPGGHKLGIFIDFEYNYICFHTRLACENPVMVFPTRQRLGCCKLWDMPVMVANDAHRLVTIIIPFVDRISKGWKWDETCGCGVFTHDAFDAFESLDRFLIEWPMQNLEPV